MAPALTGSTGVGVFKTFFRFTSARANPAKTVTASLKSVWLDSEAHIFVQIASLYPQKVMKL